MPLDIRLLEAFRSVMENQSVTGAARVLGLTQPAVSAQIARLEAQLGFELFERAGGRLCASESGRRFYREVRTVLSGVERLSDVARGIRSGAGEAVSVASHPGASVAIMPRVMAALRRQRPDARLRLISRNSEEVLSIFTSGAAEIGIAEWPVPLQDVELRRRDLACVAITPPGFAPASTPLSPADLADTPLVAMHDTRLIGMKTREALTGAGLAWAPVAESEYFSALCCMVAQGCGWALVDPLTAATFQPLGFDIHPFHPTITYQIAVFRRASVAPTPLCDTVFNLIVDATDGTRTAPHGAETTAEA
jgi:DNA-binding transcriptional LysR family regulator